MGKLVLYLADGTTLDIRLARERITIGRRADNDVCLPYPAVSGEHAAVVTILVDSFLEDLGSTNGTLVNGKTIAKHFLRDRDQIDIGRQKLVYVADESVQLEAGPQSLGRLEAQLYGERVEAGEASAEHRRPGCGSGRGQPRPQACAEWRRRGSISIALSRRSLPTPSVVSKAQVPAPAAAPEPVRAVAAEPEAPTPAIRVLTGPSAGRELPLDKDEMAVGRVGVQVAAVRRANGEYRLVPLEGATPPSVNGAAVPADGLPLKSGDSFEIAGVRLEMIERPSRPA